MVDYGIAPTFSEDDESFDIPPPPPYAFRGAEPLSAPVTDLEFNGEDSLPSSDEVLTNVEDNAPFSDEPLNGLEHNGQNGARYSDRPPRDLELLRNDYELEHTLSEHIFKYGEPEPSGEPTDTESDEEETMKEIERKRSSWMKNRLLMLCILLTMLLVIFLGLTGHWVNENKKLKSQQLAIVEANEARANTRAPTDSPTIAPTDAPSLAPTECVDEVLITKECYNFDEEIFLTFRYCSPEDKNWLGIYRQGAASDEGSMNQRSFYWQLSCGGHGTSCETPMGSGNLTMTPTLGAGTYQIYGIGNMTKPYHFNSKSNSFIIRENCERDSHSRNPSYGN